MLKHGYKKWTKVKKHVFDTQLTRLENRQNI